MGIDDKIVDKILNHTDKKLKATYNLYSYDKEKRVALRKWDKKLQSILNTQPAKSNLVHI
jgi:hypothetical protein